MATRSPLLATFAITVITTVGGGVLALPTALATFGPVGAGITVIVIGLLNVLTISAIANAIARSSAIASGRGRIAVLCAEHLGATSALTATITSALMWFGIMTAYAIGVARTAEEALDVDEVTAAVVLMVIVALLVALQARRAFVASAVAVALVNIVLLLALIAIVATRSTWDHFTTGVTAFDEGRSTADAVSVVFGTVLLTFFGHTGMFSIAPEVLRADPSGRSLRRGAVGAMAVASLVSAAWAIAALSAIDPEVLVGEKSTGLAEIVDVVGRASGPISTVFVLLAMGGGVANAAFALGDIVDERLPQRRRLDTVLRAGMSVEAHDGSSIVRVTISVARDGDDLQLVARAHNGKAVAREVITDADWDATALLRQVGVTRRSLWLRVEATASADGGIVTTIESSMPLDEFPVSRGGADLLDDDGLRRQIVRALVRRPLTLDQLAVVLDVEVDEVARAIDGMVVERSVRRAPSGELSAVLGNRHRARSALVASLYAELTGEATAADEPMDRPIVSPVTRRVLITLPTVLVLAVTVLLLHNGVNFTAVLSLVGMSTIVMLGGVLPLLLALSLRRRAERWIPPSLADRPLIVWALVALFAGICALHAVFIYESWLERAVAAATFLVIVLVAEQAWRGGAFRPRSTLSVEVDRHGGLHPVALVAGMRQHAAGPPTLGATDGAVAIDTDPLPSPVLLLALSEQGVPPQLAEWRARGSDGATDTGRITDASGELIDLPTDVVQVRWSLR